MSHRLKDQGGYVVVTAVIVMGLMLSIGLAAFAVVDTQQSNSRQQRERESSFNLTEGALVSQGVNLPTSWPSAAAPYPAECNPTTALTDDRCPTPAQIAASFNAAEFTGCSAPACTWTVRVRDNGTAGGDVANPPSDYTPATDAAQCLNADGSAVTPAVSPCTFDSNKDNQLWVRAQGVTRGRTRTIVALLKLEQFPEPFPSSAITAGSIEIIPNGNQTYVNTGGADVIVRCDGSAGPSPGDPCQGWDDDKGHVSPATYTDDATTGPALSSAALQRLRDTAARTFTCGADKQQACLFTPSTDAQCKDIDLNGVGVYIEPTNASVRCKISANSNFNSMASPGFLVMTDGILDLSGTITYFGVLYHTNGCSAAEGTGCADSTATPCKTPIQTSGGLSITGAVSIDGCGRFQFGSTSGVLTFDPNAKNVIQSTGVAGLVQNTWRELPPNF